jgi:hypothetical protein
MAENRARGRSGKLGMIGPLSIVAVIALVIVGALVFTRSRPPPPTEPAAAPVPTTPAPAPAPATPPPDPVLTRSDLAAAMAAAADRYAAGEPPARGGRDPLAGRRYVLRIPFGCEGPQLRPGAAQAFYTFDAETRTVRLVARPATWTGLALIQDTTQPEALEAVEGFWVPHPWTASEACPVPRDKPVPASPTPPAAETLGLARLFVPGASRVDRRGERPYEQVVRLKADEAPPAAQGYRLVLEGRLDTFPDGRVGHCWSESPAHRPICLLAATFERVAFETADGQRLAEWREGP